MTLSHLTVSEVNGGLDGLLLGNHFKDRPNDAPKLSQILDIYYQGSGHKNRYTNIRINFCKTVRKEFVIPLSYDANKGN